MRLVLTELSNIHPLLLGTEHSSQTELKRTQEKPVPPDNLSLTTGRRHLRGGARGLALTCTTKIHPWDLTYISSMQSLYFRETPN